VPASGLAPLNVNVDSTVGGTFIEVTPWDLNTDSDGFTAPRFARSYHEGTEVTVTAPWRSEGLRFLRWNVDGVMQPVGLRTLGLMITDSTMVEAIFERAPSIQPEGPPGGLR